MHITEHVMDGDDYSRRKSLEEMRIECENDKDDDFDDDDGGDDEGMPPKHFLFIISL